MRTLVGWLLYKFRVQTLFLQRLSSMQHKYTTKKRNSTREKKRSDGEERRGRRHRPERRAAAETGGARARSGGPNFPHDEKQRETGSECAEEGREGGR